MIEDGLPIEKSIDEGETNLVLPIKRTDLGEFISSLLGQQQTIEREVELAFEIDHQWLVNLHELIQQRIYQQANANLVNFKSVIYFDNGLKRSLTTAESFLSYAESKKNIPIGIKILWTYLIQFPKSKYPEKQQISFSAQIHNSNTGEQAQLSKEKEDLSLFSSLVFSDSQRPKIHLQIDHTERTWGDDLESIISNEIDGVVRTSKVKNYFYNISRLVLAMFIAIGGVVYSLTYRLDNYVDLVRQELNNYQKYKNAIQDNLEHIAAKTDVLIKLEELRIERSSDFGSFFLLMFGSLFMATLVLFFTKKNMHSFLLLSKEAYKNKDIILKKERKSTYVFILSFVASVTVSILANYGYSWLTG
jgi:hypothetical protein